MNPARIFVYSAGVLLLGVALALVIGIWASLEVAQPIDPVLRISVHTLWWIVWGLCAAVAVACLFGERMLFQLAWVAWLATNIGVYVAGHFWTGGRNFNVVLGSLPDAFAISPRIAGLIGEIIFGYLLVGSYGLMLWLWLDKRDHTTGEGKATRNVEVAGIQPKSGFTLVEMLVVMAVIGILAGLLLPALARAKAKAHQMACLNNLRQLGIAFQLYQGTSNDQFPTPGSKDAYGPQPEDWIWWQYGRGVEKSSIVPFVSNFKAELYTCPADKDAKALQSQGELKNDPYRYSYSFNSHDLVKTNGAHINPGMSTIITWHREVFSFKGAQISKPSGKLMLVEEDRKTINDPRWIPRSNPVAPRHKGRGNGTFADGHSEAVTAKFAHDPANSNPSL